MGTGRDGESETEQRDWYVVEDELLELRGTIGERIKGKVRRFADATVESFPDQEVLDHVRQLLKKMEIF